MRVFTDPATGELVEVLDTQVVGLEPYDYRQAKAAAFQVSLRRQHAVENYKTAIALVAKAEAEYRKQLALAIVRQTGPATTAEVLARGEEPVLEALKAFRVADGMRYARLEEIRGIDGDRISVSQFTGWSKEQATGPWGER